MQGRLKLSAMSANGEGSSQRSSEGKRPSISDCPTCGAPLSPFITECPFCGSNVSKRSKLRAFRLRLRSRVRNARQRRRQIPTIKRPRLARTRPRTGTPYAVGFLMLANIFGYLAFDARSDLFTDPGALSSEAVRAGEVSRLITYQFLHTGVLELIFSLLMLLVFASAVEGRFGHFVALSCYLAAGVGGGLLAVAVGTNGAVAGSLVSTVGLMGAWLVMTVRPLHHEQAYPLPAALFIIAIIFLYGLLQEGVDAWALLGGLVCGTGLALAADYHSRRR